MTYRVLSLLVMSLMVGRVVAAPPEAPSVKVLPCDAAQDESDVAVVQTKFGGKLLPVCFTGRVSSSHFTDLRFRDLSVERLFALSDLLRVQFGPMSLCPTRVEGTANPSAFGTSLLRRHVGHVVSVSAEKKMLGAHAQWVITPVADRQAIGDRPDMELIGKPVRRHTLAVLASKSNEAVAVSVSGPRPEPTGIVLGHISPEPYFRRRPLVLAPAGLGVTTIKLVLPYENCFATNTTATPARVAVLPNRRLFNYQEVAERPSGGNRVVFACYRMCSHNCLQFRHEWLGLPAVNGRRQSVKPIIIRSDW